MKQNYQPDTIERTYGIFEFCGYRFPLFAHHHNCGHPPGTMSERSIELSLASVFLETAQRDSVVEIGAVTPYYWPHRVKDICDPVDPHPLVNMRASYLDIALKDKVVLSLSTFEHIGQSDYGLPENSSLNQQAFEKLFREAEHFLVTVPGGYNLAMDDYLLGLDCVARNVSVRHLIRVKGNHWVEKKNPLKSELVFCYGAYSLMVVSRGTFLDSAKSLPSAQPISGAGKPQGQRALKGSE